MYFSFQAKKYYFRGGPGGWVENVHLCVPSVIVKGD